MEKHNLEKVKEEISKVRVRFAPSPTGPLHIGGVRTALFNYLFSKKHKGSFILRIEDSDFKRSKSEYENDILNSLKWLGIEWQEGPIIAAQIQKSKISTIPHNKNQKYIGEYGPYRQSERLSIYVKYLKKLLKENKAYYCFCSKEEIEAQRQYQISIGEAPHYIGKCQELPEKIVKQYLSQKKESVIRFKIMPKTIVFNDIIRGKLKFDSALIGDIIIAKDFFSVPFYNFAVVIDDFEMKITHIIRGEEHISNTPIQILIQEALGFSQLKYVHLPLVLGLDRSKLSKRDDVVSIKEYEKDGYLPEALINFLVFLGWNPGTEKEIFSKNSLIQEFSLEKIQKSGAIFNIKRLNYLNGFYIRSKSSKNLIELCLPYLIKNGFIENIKTITSNKNFKIKETGEIIDFEWLNKIIKLEQQRMKKTSEICSLVDFFFKNRLQYDKELLRWKNMSDKEIIKILKRIEKILFRIKPQNFNKETLRKILMPKIKKGIISIIKRKLSVTQQILAGDKGRFLWPLRVALSGKQASPGPFEIAEILGKEKTLKRIRQAYKNLLA